MSGQETHFASAALSQAMNDQDACWQGQIICCANQAKDRGETSSMALDSCFAEAFLMPAAA